MLLSNDTKHLQGWGFLRPLQTPLDRMRTGGSVASAASRFKHNQGSSEGGRLKRSFDGLGCRSFEATPHDDDCKSWPLRSRPALRAPPPEHRAVARPASGCARRVKPSAWRVTRTPRGAGLAVFFTSSATDKLSASTTPARPAIDFQPVRSATVALSAFRHKPHHFHSSRTHTR
jgi:hypothetical protein